MVITMIFMIIWLTTVSTLRSFSLGSSIQLCWLIQDHNQEVPIRVKALQVDLYYKDELYMRDGKWPAAVLPANQILGLKIFVN